MPCPCAHSVRGVGPVLTLAARAVICTACTGGRDVCPVSGAAAASHVVGAECPRGKHPDEQGTVRRVWLTWEGVPLPERAYVWWRWRRDKPWREFRSAVPGCGCIVPLKRAWGWIVERYNEKDGYSAVEGLPSPVLAERPARG